jgi:Tfp pilus assembly protein PilZ
MKKKEHRSFVRTNTLLPFLARPLPSDECDSMECRLTLGGIVFEDAPPPSVGDEHLCQWLNMLNAKLDYLISLTVPERKGFVTMKFEPLNISASGMAIVTQEAVQIGDVIEIRIVLQAYPAKILYLYGEVVRIQPTRGKHKRYSIGLKFLNMTDEVRNEILKFDFKKHRERLITIKRP